MTQTDGNVDAVELMADLIREWVKVNAGWIGTEPCTRLAYVLHDAGYQIASLSAGASKRTEQLERLRDTVEDYADLYRKDGGVVWHDREGMHCSICNHTWDRDSEAAYETHAKDCPVAIAASIRPAVASPPEDEPSEVTVRKMRDEWPDPMADWPVQERAADFDAVAGAWLQEMIGKDLIHGFRGDAVSRLSALLRRTQAGGWRDGVEAAANSLRQSITHYQDDCDTGRRIALELALKALPASPTPPATEE